QPLHATQPDQRLPRLSPSDASGNTGRRAAAVEFPAMQGEEFKDDFRKALPKALLQRLTQRSAWRATLPILEDFAVIALAAAVALASWFSLPITIVCVLIIGVKQHAL